jgi:hypothetical protein
LGGTSSEDEEDEDEEREGKGSERVERKIRMKRNKRKECKLRISMPWTQDRSTMQQRAATEIQFSILVGRNIDTAVH